MKSEDLTEIVNMAANEVFQNNESTLRGFGLDADQLEFVKLGYERAAISGAIVGLKEEHESTK